MPWNEVEAMLAAVRAACEVVPLLPETHDRALTIAKRYGYGIYDSTMIASACEAGCTLLYSEDMRDGQRIDGVTICNPFLGL